MADLTGRDIGRYHIVERLGQGGMAEVYKAFDTRLEREVAIKVIRRDAIAPALYDAMLKRFDREAKALAQLWHNHIVKVFDFGEFEDAPFLVMEYLTGGTLSLKAAGKPMDWREAARLLAPIARALEYAHGEGILHRDVKPANILINSKGEPMLSDFGIAKILESDTSTQLTATNMGIGTPEYMAPEQWQGKPVPQTDIYSLGVVFYELVTGKKPYSADTPVAVMLKQASEPLPRPRNYIPGLPDEVERVLFKALAKDPADRYANMGEFAAALEKIASGALITHSTLAHGVPVAPIQPHTDDSTVVEGPPMPAPPPVTKNKWLPWVWVGGAAGVLFLFMMVLIPLVLIGSRVLQGAIKLTPTSNIPGTGLTPTPSTLAVQTLAPTREGQSDTPTLTWLPTDTATPPVSSWNQGKLVLLMGSPTLRDVYWMDLQTGGELKFLAGASGNQRFLGTILSPDGRRVVWYDAFYARLMQVDLSGGQAGTLAKCTEPFFSPDGSQVICNKNGVFQIISSSGGTVQNQLTTGVDRSALPAWSPAGDEVVFAAFGSDRSSSIWRISLADSGATPLANTNFENYAPAWSPDGKWIAFQSAQSSGTSEIWIMDRTGGQLQQITHNGVWSRGPCFSPDGQWLAFVSGLAGSVGPDSGEVFAISLKTGEQIQLTHTGGKVYDWRVFWGR